MGCWNGTCALSHLPIIAGEKVRGYILVPADLLSGYKRERDLLTGGSFCYSSHVMHPLSYGIRGKYDDYGSMENIKKDPNNAKILEYVNDLLKSERIKIYAEDDRAKKASVRSVSSITDLISMIERGQTPFAFVMILESVLQAAVKAVDEDSKTETSPHSVSIDNALKELEMIRDFRKNTPEASSVFLRSQFPKLPNVAWNRMGALIFSDHGENPFFDSMFAMDYMWSMVELNDPKVNQQLIEHTLLCISFAGLRRAWLPQTGAGSQDESYGLHRKVAQSVLDHIAARRQASIDDTNVEEYPEELEHINSRF